MIATTGNAPRDLHFGDEGFWPYGEVTPPTRESKTIDLNRVRFDWRDMCVVVGLVGAFWLLRSDNRDIVTRIDMQEKIYVEKAKVQELEISALRTMMENFQKSSDAGDRKFELLRLEFQQLREQVLFKGKK